MILNKKYFGFENVIFYLLLVFNLINLWSVNIYTTMDGPSHLYNASLLNVFQKSDFLKQYYVHNEFFLPNYLPHFILGKLCLLINPFRGEKIFLSAIVVFLPLSFRYLVKTISGNKNVLFILVFTLVFTFLFQLGFFSFSVAFIFLNCQLILAHYMINNRLNTSTVLAYLTCVIALYYTHPFVYVVSLSTTLLYVFVVLVKSPRELLKKISILISLSLPTIILFYFFITKIQITGVNDIHEKDISFGNKLAGLYNFAPAIAYISDSEIIYARLISGLIGVLMVAVFLNRFVIQKETNKFYPTDIFIVLAVITAISIFCTNNGILGGMFTNRLTYLSFYFIMLWLACSKIESKVILFGSVIVVMVSYIKLSLIRHDKMALLNYHAWQISKAKPYVKNNSVIFSVNYSNNWLETHFSDYIGINKEVVVSGNYEATLGWFPLRWNAGNIFRLKCESDKVQKNIIVPDYVLIYGRQDKINLQINRVFKNFISTKTFLCYESSDKFCKLFKVIK